MLGQPTQSQTEFGAVHVIAKIQVDEHNVEPLRCAQGDRFLRGRCAVQAPAPWLCPIPEKHAIGLHILNVENIETLGFGNHRGWRKRGEQRNGRW